VTTSYDYPLLIRHLLHTPLANAAEQEIIHAGVSRYTYHHFGERIVKLACALTQLGVGPGKVVAVMDWDSHRYLECFFAVPMLGATLHTINIRLSDTQILYTINHAEDDVILVHKDFLPVLERIRVGIIKPPEIVVLRDKASDSGLPSGVAYEYETLIAQQPVHFAFKDFDERTRATLFYTTGTTGDPKGVSFTHRQLVLHTLAVGATLGPIPGHGGFHRGDVYMPITPLFHVHGWGFPYLATLFGVKQIYPGRYEPAKLLELIAQHGVTFSHCVPTILNMLLSAPEAASTDLSKWKVLIGGSALPHGLAERAIARGIDIHAAYGSSETCPFVTVADMVASQHEGDTVAVRVAAGRAVPMVELRVVDENMQDISRDGAATGEVVVRAPWLTQDYFKNEAASRDLWRGGYLHTGDVGRLDATSTLKITDRVKDVIKSGGEWISSLALEDLASAVPGVSEVAAIGVPDEKWGERPCMMVAARSGTDMASLEKSIRAVITQAIAAGKLSKWASPDRLHFVDALPKTSVGKIDKNLIRAQLASASGVKKDRA
jgi:fatty-acyl-CoA synthase